jgi:uncharacterized protein (DUF2062 family)
MNGPDAAAGQALGVVLALMLVAAVAALAVAWLVLRFLVVASARWWRGRRTRRRARMAAA